MAFLDTASVATLHASGGDAEDIAKKGFTGLNLSFQRMGFANPFVFTPKEFIWVAIDANSQD